MEINSAIIQLSALAHDSRLRVFRLLVRRGSQGIAAGQLSEQLDIPAATLNFHLSQLTSAGLVSSRRDGRHIYYSAAYDAMAALMRFLTEHCCHDDPTCGGDRTTIQSEEISS